MHEAERVAFVLRVSAGTSLDGYVFADENHARQWMSQKFVREHGGYRCERVRQRRGEHQCKACGHVEWSDVEVLGTLEIKAEA
jgi:hypothetical protein